jgi:two-component system CheB/CheR fusion protein
MTQPPTPSHPGASSIEPAARARTHDGRPTPEELMRLIVENAREYAIFSLDTNRKITTWNTGAERVLGYAEDEVLGLSADIIFTPEDRAADAPQAELRQALTEGRAGDDRFHRRKDGSLFWASGVMMAMRDDDGQTVGCVKILRDQTEVRRTQQALERSQAELTAALLEKEQARAALEAANVAKDQFLAVLSHELRTPLTPVVMAVQLLLRRTDLPPGAREALDMILRNIRLESHLIDDLLDLTRISRGTLEIVREPVDMHQAIRAAVEVCAADFESRQQRLTLALAAPSARVVGDADRLQQVVWNLLKNASKFTPRGGEIDLATHEGAGHLEIRVRDSGIGIDPHALPRIFDAFVQGGTWVAREFGGLGLGLAISQATIAAHGGSLRAHSAGRGQGATFTLELPLAGSEEPDER